MSAGSRSGVNWMRLKPAPIEAASALASVVLPVPGVSSISTWPPPANAARSLRTDACWPRITLSMFDAMRSNRRRASCASTIFPPAAMLACSAKNALHQARPDGAFLERRLPGGEHRAAEHGTVHLGLRALRVRGADPARRAAAARAPDGAGVPARDGAGDRPRPAGHFGLQRAFHRRACARGGEPGGGDRADEPGVHGALRDALS